MAIGCLHNCASKCYVQYSSNEVRVHKVVYQLVGYSFTRECASNVIDVAALLPADDGPIGNVSGRISRSVKLYLSLIHI